MKSDFVIIITLISEGWCHLHSLIGLLLQVDLDVDLLILLLVVVLPCRLFQWLQLLLFLLLVELVLLVLTAITCELFNIEYDVVFDVFLLDLLEFPLEASASLSVALGEGVPAEGFDDLREEATRGALLLLLPDDVGYRVVEYREVTALESAVSLEFIA